jgi:hypothetical protein
VPPPLLNRAPIDHMDDCTGSKYFLQLNVYRYILRKYYNVHVSKMILVSMHPNLENYYMVEVPVRKELHLSVH